MKHCSDSSVTGLRVSRWLVVTVTYKRAVAHPELVFGMEYYGSTRNPHSDQINCDIVLITSFNVLQNTLRESAIQFECVLRTLNLFPLSTCLAEPETLSHSQLMVTDRRVVTYNK